MDVEMPDGTLIQDVPDGTTKAQLLQKYQAHQAASSMSWADVPAAAAKNFLPSAGRLIGNTVNAITHPIDTGKAVLGAAMGGAAELGDMLPDSLKDPNFSKDPVLAGARQNFDAMKSYIGDRYGSAEGLKNTLANDPAGALGDASIFLGGTGGALEASGTLGKAGSIASKAGEMANPIGAGLSALKATGNLSGKALGQALGVTTGAGAQSISAAFDAGKAGGSAGDAFLSHLRGNAPIDEIVGDAQGALSKLEQARGADYRSGIGSVNSDPTVLSLSPIDQAIAQGNSINNFKGLDLAPSTAKVRQQIADTVDLWRQQNPQDFHTAAGFDALKKAIGNIRDTTDYGTPERAVADQAYHAVRAEVANQAPDYASVMSNYADASDKLNELRSTFSLGEGKAQDTAIRKLQGALRDNVNTNFGYRTQLAQQLSDAGAPDLQSKIAGQSLRSATPRGIGQLLASGEFGGAAATAAMGHPAAAASLLPLMLAQSPRAVGEASYYAGKGAKLATMLAPSKQNAATAALATEILNQKNSRDRPFDPSIYAQILQGAH